MNANDLSLSATGKVGAAAGLTGQPAAGWRAAGSDSSFEQELRRQTEAGPSADAAAAAKAKPATKAEPEPAADGQATDAREDKVGDPAADWLALVDGMRARSETKPAAAPVAPEPAAESLTALATPGAGDAISTANATGLATEPARSAGPKTAEREASEPTTGNAADGAQLQPPLTPLSTMVPALQPAAPASPTAAAPATTELESASDALGARTQPRRVTQPEAGELDAISARALAAALPQPSNRPAVAAGAGPGAEALTAPDPMAQALPATQATATGAEPLVDAPPVQRHVATPMGQRGWDQAVSQQVSWLVRDQLQSASLSLNPPHLGPIQITLQLDQQQASVQFVAAAPEVRQALQEALPVLRAMLGEAGISLGQADVGSRQSGREQAAPQRAARGTQAVEDEPVEALLPPRAQGSGLVNLFA